MRTTTISLSTFVYEMIMVKAAITSRAALHFSGSKPQTIDLYFFSWTVLWFITMSRQKIKLGQVYEHCMEREGTAGTPWLSLRLLFCFRKGFSIMYFKLLCKIADTCTQFYIPTSHVLFSQSQTLDIMFSYTLANIGQHKYMKHIQKLNKVSEFIQ